MASCLHGAFLSHLLPHSPPFLGLEGDPTYLTSRQPRLSVMNGLTFDHTKILCLLDPGLPSKPEVLHH